MWVLYQPHSPKSVTEIKRLCRVYKVTLPHVGPSTKDVWLTPAEGGLRNPDVQSLFECESIVLSGRRGRRGSRNPGFCLTSFVNGPCDKTFFSFLCFEGSY